MASFVTHEFPATLSKTPDSLVLAARDGMGHGNAPHLIGGALSAFKSVLDDRVRPVNKVDVMEARRGLQPIGGKPPPGQVTHAPYRREPYVRAQLDDGRTVDAKAAAWTRTHVLLHWKDADGKAWNVWVVAVRVRRITAEESGWRDVYDLEW